MPKCKYLPERTLSYRNEQGRADLGAAEGRFLIPTPSRLCSLTRFGSQRCHLSRDEPVESRRRVSLAALRGGKPGRAHEYRFPG